MSALDLKLLGGEFFAWNFPPEFQYLTKYFRTDLGRTFAFYYLTFSGLIELRNIKFFLDNFVDHTGFCCSEQRLRYLLKRLQYLLNAAKKAEQDFDLEAIEKIKIGKFRLSEC